MFRQVSKYQIKTQQFYTDSGLYQVINSFRQKENSKIQGHFKGDLIFKFSRKPSIFKYFSSLYQPCLMTEDRTTETYIFLFFQAKWGVILVEEKWLEIRSNNLVFLQQNNYTYNHDGCPENIFISSFTKILPASGNS